MGRWENHQTDDTQPAITGRYHGKNDMVFAVGPAGTGKNILSCNGC
jgi:phosphate starvation-inducible protein PhoH